MTVSDEMLLNEAKYQGYSFYRFWDKGEPTGAGLGGVKLPPHPLPPLSSNPNQIRVKGLIQCRHWNTIFSKLIQELQVHKI